MKIIFNNKELEVEMIHDAIAKRGKYHYIQCPITKEWMFRHEKAWNALCKKHHNNLNDIAAVVSNKGKKIANGESIEIEKPKKQKRVEKQDDVDMSEAVYVGVAGGICRCEPVGFKGALAKRSWKADISIED